MEDQNATTIQLMSKIIELHEELRCRQNGLEEKVMQYLKRMTKKIMERLEEIGKDFLKTSNENMAMILQPVDTLAMKVGEFEHRNTEMLKEVVKVGYRVEDIDMKMNEKFDKILKRYIELSGHDHGDDSVDDRPDDNAHGDDSVDDRPDDNAHGDDSVDDRPDDNAHGDDSVDDRPDDNAHGDDSVGGRPDDNAHGGDGLGDRPDDNAHGDDSVGDRPDNNAHGDVSVGDRPDNNAHGGDGLGDRPDENAHGFIQQQQQQQQRRNADDPTNADGHNIEDSQIGVDDDFPDFNHIPDSRRSKRISSSRVNYEESSDNGDLDNTGAESEDDLLVEYASPKSKKPKINFGPELNDGKGWIKFTKVFSREGKKIYECTKCDQVFNGTMNDIKGHIEEQHLHVTHSCVRCAYVGRSKTTLVEHIKAQHPEVHFACHRKTQQPQPGTSQAAASIADNGQSDQAMETKPAPSTDGKKVPKVKDWREYLKTDKVNGRTIFGCTKCAKIRSAQKNNLKCHIQGKHLGVVFRCAHCPYDVRSKSGLICHIKKNHPEVRFKCPDCPYTTRLAESLHHHRTTFHETELGPFQAEMVEDNEPRARQSESLSSKSEL